MEQQPESIETKQPIENYKESLDIFENELKSLLERLDNTKEVLDGLSTDKIEKMGDYFNIRADLFKEGTQKLRGANKWDTLSGDVSVQG
jgi:hypothetical protein